MHIMGVCVSACARVSYEEEDTCVSYDEEDTCMSVYLHARVCVCRCFLYDRCAQAGLTICEP